MAEGSQTRGVMEKGLIWEVRGFGERVWRRQCVAARGIMVRSVVFISSMRVAMWFLKSECSVFESEG